MKQQSVILPACFGQAVPYFPQIYLRKPTQLIGKRLEVGWQQFKILHPDSSFTWRLPKSVKLVCTIDSQYRALAKGLHNYAQTSRKGTIFRHIFNIKLLDAVMQVQLMVSYVDYARSVITSARNQIATCFVNEYSEMTTESFMAMALQTDFEAAILVIRSKYPGIKFISVTKCRHV